MHDAVCADCGKQTQVPFQPDRDQASVLQRLLPEAQATQKKLLKRSILDLFLSLGCNL